MKRVFAFLLVAGVLTMAAPPAAATEKGQGETDAQVQEMMALYAKLAEPGEHHAHMARLAGSWKAEVTWWLTPGAEPITSPAKAEMKMILGGRFLQMDYSGEFMGQPFTGLGISGYDNGAKKHIDVWMDTMGTMMLVSEGQCSEGGKVTEMTSEFTDPMTGEPSKIKSISRVISDDKLFFEMHAQAPDGTMFKTMEITYTR